MSVELPATQLQLDAPVQASFSADVPSVYYVVDVEADKDLEITLTDLDGRGENELYVGYDRVPSRSEFDYRGSQPLSPHQKVRISGTRAGRYCILAYSKALIPGDANLFEVSARLLPFQVVALSPARGSASSMVTCKLIGAGFTPLLAVSLVGSDGVSCETAQTRFSDSSSVFATFDLSELPPGKYDVRAEQEEGSSVVEGGFEVIAGGGPALEARVVAPTLGRAGRYVRFTIEYANTGTADLPAPLFVVEGGENSISVPGRSDICASSLQVLGISSDGPAGVLRPGASGRIELLCKVPNALTLKMAAAVDTDLNWAGFVSSAKPSFLSDQEWSERWEQMSLSMGQDQRALLLSLAEQATVLSEARGQRMYLVRDLYLGTAACANVGDPLDLPAQDGGFPQMRSAAAASAGWLGVPWSISSPYGFRDLGGKIRFHDGFDVPGSMTVKWPAGLPNGSGRNGFNGGYGRVVEVDFGTDALQFCHLASFAQEPKPSESPSSVYPGLRTKKFAQAVTAGVSLGVSGGSSLVEIPAASGHWAVKDGAYSDHVHVKRGAMGTNGANPLALFSYGGQFGDPFCKVIASSVTYAQSFSLACAFDVLSHDLESGSLELVSVDGDTSVAKTVYSFDLSKPPVGNWDYLLHPLWRSVGGLPSGVLGNTRNWYTWLESAPGNSAAVIALPPPTDPPRAEHEYRYRLSAFTAGNVLVGPPYGVAGDIFIYYRPATGATEPGINWDETQDLPGAGIVRIGSADPNSKIGPLGWGEAKFISGRQPIPYTVQFENLETATAATLQVSISDPLSPSLDWSTLTLGDIAFAGHVIRVPDGLNRYQGEVQLEGWTWNEQQGWHRGETPLLVKVNAGIDMVTGVAEWVLTAVDPLTGDFPDDPYAGLLPPNLETLAYENPEMPGGMAHPGEGYVSYRLAANSNLPSGTQISNAASIVFDSNAPIVTPSTTNTIDGGAPWSHVLPLAEKTEEALLDVRWAGGDDAGGSGIAHYDIYVREDDGPAGLWLSSAETLASYQAEVGHRYSFYSVAHDNVGNVQPVPEQPDTSTVVVSQNAEPVAENDFAEVGAGDWIDVPVLNNDLDPDGDALTLLDATPGSNGTTTINPDGTIRYAPNPGFAGTDAFYYQVTDGKGGIAWATVTMTVTEIDSLPPTIVEAKASPDILWPANHRMVPVEVAVTARDNSDPCPVTKILRVTSDEPVKGTGSGDTSPDWEVSGPLRLRLRSERSGSGDGRVYTITVECTDASGNSAYADVHVTVSHDRR